MRNRPVLGPALLAGVLALAAGCGSSTGTAGTPSNSASPTASPAAVAATYHVSVDGNKAELGVPVNEAFLAYYPKAVSVHPGDTVEFALADSGEPHTVALGALVDKAAAAVKALPPHSDPPPAVLAELKKVPDLLPQGPGDAVQAGANPCYQATGLPGTKDACPVKAGDFTGTESLVSSGWMGPDTPFALKISENAKPGTYTYFCQLHGPSMSATLTIVDKAATIPTAAEVEATALAELKADSAKLAPTVAQVQSATVAKAVAGAGSQALEYGLVDAFGPSQIKVPVGGSVTWNVFGPHTIYFNAPTDAEQARVVAPDGTVHYNAKAAMPAGGPGAGAKPGLINGGVWDGKGPRSSGLILSFPPMLSSYKLTFSKAGTFAFQCTIHTNMKGQVTVG